jgi:hypothetical protein
LIELGGFGEGVPPTYSRGGLTKSRTSYIIVWPILLNKYLKLQKKCDAEYGTNWNKNLSFRGLSRRKDGLAELPKQTYRYMPERIDITRGGGGVSPIYDNGSGVSPPNVLPWGANLTKPLTCLYMILTATLTDWHSTQTVTDCCHCQLWHDITFCNL